MSGAGREHGTDPAHGHVPADAPAHVPVRLRDHVPGHAPGHVPMGAPGQVSAHVDLVAVRIDRTAPAGGTTVLRLLSLLPPDWDCAPRSVASDRIMLRIAPGPSADRGAVRGTVRGVLADRALAGWAVGEPGGGRPGGGGLGGGGPGRRCAGAVTAVARHRHDRPGPGRSRSPAALPCHTHPRSRASSAAWARLEAPSICISSAT